MAVTNAAIDHILNAEFASGPRVSTWYLGVISGAGTPVLRATDTMASHPGWFEVTFRDVFGNLTRPAWRASYAGGAFGQAANLGPIAFTSPAVVHGMFLATSYPQGSTSGLLFATVALVDAPRTVAAGDTLDMTLWVAVSS